MPYIFDHEKLKRLSRILELRRPGDRTLERVPKTMAVHNQLDRASTAISLNIAEGIGKFTPPDRCRLL